MVPCPSDVLLLPRDALSLAVSAEAVGHEGIWAENVVAALDELEIALREHTALAELPNGIYSGVDLNRPTLVRKINQLRWEHEDLMEELHALQHMVRCVVRAFCCPGSADTMRFLPEVTAPGPVPDFGAIRSRVAQFVASLVRHEETEDLVVMESVSCEIGIGD